MPGRVYKRGKTYWLSFYHKGVEYRRSTKTDKKREAEKILAHFLGQCARGEFKGFQDSSHSLTINELFDDLVVHFRNKHRVGYPTSGTLRASS
jgi:hypothetical protein